MKKRPDVEYQLYLKDIETRKEVARYLPQRYWLNKNKIDIKDLDEEVAY